ncbi:MAG: NUDIX domain-containing protein [Verrucomicrobiota bacterium]|jgi:8-oxo-dGTP pyrophosphatase MutT (NUDIX family)|nr:NUDIX domain-containing protein [Verrucomicrobiota bacterium]
MKKMAPAEAGKIEVIARGVCVKKGGVLLCRNRKYGNVYFPGGHVDWGEDSKQALEREWDEELGVPGRAGRFLGVVEQMYEARNGKTCEISLVFEMKCRSLSGTRHPSSAEAHLAFEWVPLAKLRASGLLPAVMAEQVPEWLKKPSAAAGRWKGYASP